MPHFVLYCTFNVLTIFKNIMYNIALFDKHGNNTI
jgi:hypothetical protein